MSQSILNIEGLSHDYGSGQGGIKEISFSVFPGEYIILAGANGSGKTTLIRHMNGLLKPDKGRVRLHGRDIFKDLVHTRKTVGMVFQDADTQIVGETVFDEVAFGPENLGLNQEAINSKVMSTLDAFRLGQFRDRHPATLSGGEKRRLTIAGVLVMDPEIIIFDEPFANLDHPGARELVGIIAGLSSSGKTIIMATHDLDLVIQDAHRMLILENGRLRAQGKASDLAKGLGEYGLKPICTCAGR